MTSRLVNDTVTFNPYSVFMEATPPAAHTCVLNKFNTTFPNIFTPYQYPDTDTDIASLDINLNLFRNFLSYLKLHGISPAPNIATGPTEPIMEASKYYCYLSSEC